jgi:adenylate cyclase
MQPGSHIEIERKFLLDRAPHIPPAAVIWKIQQGYLHRTEDQHVTDGSRQFATGRLRCTTYQDQSTKYFHSIKTGAGISRIEHEREISHEEFRRAWPRTAGQRLTKTRYRICEGALIWEIDVFDEIDLALAEIELPTIDAEFTIPHWLKPHVVREVTDDPSYTNASIARLKRLSE